jgi:hypothetical protein
MFVGIFFSKLCDLSTIFVVVQSHYPAAIAAVGSCRPVWQAIVVYVFAISLTTGAADWSKAVKLGWVRILR